MHDEGDRKTARSKGKKNCKNLRIFLTFKLNWKGEKTNNTEFTGQQGEQTYLFSLWHCYPNFESRKRGDPSAIFWGENFTQCPSHDWGEGPVLLEVDGDRSFLEVSSVDLSKLEVFAATQKVMFVCC